MRISVYIASSVDGYIAGVDGDVSWLDEYNQDPDEDYGFGAFFASVDCVVMGRKTFEKVLSFDEWGYAGKQVVVLSGSGVAIPDRLASSVECLAGPPAEVVGNLEGRGFEHLYIDGGTTICGFLAAGLIETLILTQTPLILGSGIPLFSHATGRLSLRLVATRHYPNGLVQTEYQVVSGASEARG